MGLFTRQPKPRRAHIRPVTASAAPVRDDTARRLRHLSQQWQQQALGYYDTVGECWYPAQFYARSFPRIRFYPAILDERGDPQEVDTGPLVEAFERINDPGGTGHTELTSSYGRLQWLIGDGYLTVTEQDGEEAWEYLSPVELRVKPDRIPNRPQEYSRLRAPGIPPEELAEAPDDDFEPLGNQARVYRLWRRHPAYSEWADSPVKGVLELYELLARLTAAAGAESTSRAANRGGFYLPDELHFAPIDAEAGGDEDPDLDIFTERFLESLNVAIQNPGSAEAMSPITVRGPGMLVDPSTQKAIPMKDAIGYFAIGPERDYAEAEMWEKTIQRIANGLDMPAEMVTRAGDVNHWGGWLLDEQGFRLHIAPSVERFCSDLTAAYLRPFAIAEGLENADRVVVWYDPADAINHPDEIKTARDAYLDGVVNAPYYRDKIGATEDDEPDEQELERLLVILGKAPAEDPLTGETSPADGGRGGDANEAPPEIDNADGQNGNGGQASEVAAARVAAAVEISLDRAREVAGNRLVRRSQGCEECRETIQNVPPALVASALGREQVRSIIDGHTTEAQLVAGAGDRLSTTVRRWGIDDPAADELGDLVERYALETLYDQDVTPLPRALALAVAKVLA